MSRQSCGIWYNIMENKNQFIFDTTEWITKNIQTNIDVIKSEVVDDESVLWIILIGNVSIYLEIFFNITDYDTFNEDVEAVACMYNDKKPRLVVADNLKTVMSRVNYLLKNV